MGKYDDIINMPHHVSEIHPQMPMHDRAAQFSPFSALTGHNEAIEETARLTESKTELSEDAVAVINEKLKFIADNTHCGVTATLTYFLPDDKKDGGEYRTFSGEVKRLDDTTKELVFKNGCVIPIENIIEIEAEKHSGS